jgi:predicted transcriptional regulator
MADTTTITLQTVIDEIKLLRKDLRKVKSLIEDPLGEKAKARSTSNGFNKPLDISEELRKFLKLAAGE